MEFMPTIKYLLMLVLFILAAIAAIIYMRWKMEGGGIWKKELKYEIIYKDKDTLKKGIIELREGGIFRVGYSGEGKYHNNLAIEQYVEENDEDEEALWEIKKRYATWFFLSMEDKKIFVKPSYTYREKLDGHKDLITKNSILKESGEFDGSIALCSDPSEEPLFTVFVYEDTVAGDYR